MSLFLVSLCLFFRPVLFYFFILLMFFLVLNNFSWSGSFLFFDSYIFLMLVFLSLFILGVVLMSESNHILLILSEFLVLFCILFFIPSSVILMYMYFELSMFPILVMILGYGSQIEKINSAYYLIFYASFCSFPFLFIYFKSSFILNLVYFDFLYSWEMLLVLSLSFMMKFPVYFLHLWLPKAHVEAPTTASMLLAGLLLKLGTAGFIRIMVSVNFSHVNLWMLISFLGMILSAFCCVFQSDSKSLAAYSSVTHMSFLLMSILFVMLSGKSSGLVLMLAHGYTSTLMFFLIGEFYHISSSRMIYYLGGFLSSSMIMSILLALVFLSNSGVPPSLSFLSEFITFSFVLMVSLFSFWILFIYFFVAFYYSLYFLTGAFMGKNVLNFDNWMVSFSIPLIIMMFNVFWFSVFF